MKAIMIAVLTLAVTMGLAAAVYAKNTPSTYSTNPQDAVDWIAQATPTPIPLPNGPGQVIPPGATPFSTNGMDFTNVTVKVATGYETVSGITGGSLAYVQADVDLYSLPNFDVGLGGHAALGAMNNGLYSAGLDFELIKNLSNFQIVGKLGAGWNFEGNPGGYGEIGADLNYNLTAGTGWGFLGNGKDTFTYCGVGIAAQAYKFQFKSSGAGLNKVLTAYVGMAL